MPTCMVSQGIAFPDGSVQYSSSDSFSGASALVWGFNVAGNLGRNNTFNSSTPVQTISGGTNWCCVSAVAGIKTDGTLWTWGPGACGVLGNNNTVNVSSPVQTVSGGTNWCFLSVSNQEMAAIKTDGSLWLWGYNFLGNLGRNNTQNQSSPVQTIGQAKNWCKVSVGYTSAAIKTDGTLWLWGRGSNGSLGNNNTVNVSSPIQTITGGTNWCAVSSPGSNVFSIKTDGTLWAWGFGRRIGDNTTINKSSPVQTISGGTNWANLASAPKVTNHMAAIKTDGTLWTWGDGTDCALGQGAVITNRSSPVQTIAGGTNWKCIALGQSRNFATKTDGTLWTWGRGTDGVLGNNTNVTSGSPGLTALGGKMGWYKPGENSGLFFRC